MSSSGTSGRGLPMLIVLLLALIVLLIGATSSEEAKLSQFLGRLLWKNATVRPPVMFFFVVLGWAWVVRLCRSCGMNIDLVLGGKLQPARATYQAALALLCMMLLSHLIHLVAAARGITWRPWLTSNVALHLCILALGVMPLRAFFAESRFSLVRTTVESLVAPLAPVTFWHVIVADYLTSLAKSLGDVQLSACISSEIFYGERAAYVPTSELWNQHYERCSQSPLNALALALPFWWRLMQCLRVYSETKEQKNLWNALKYSTAFPLVYCGYLRKQDATGGHDRPFVIAAIVQSSFTFGWDVLMDWGLPRRDGAAACGVGMREVLLVTRRQWVYLLLCAVNLALRFLWTLSFVGMVPGRGGGMFVLELAEVVRRTVWAVFRIEWEMVAKGHTRSLAAEAHDDYEKEEMLPLGELRSSTALED